MTKTRKKKRSIASSVGKPTFRSCPSFQQSLLFSIFESTVTNSVSQKHGLSSVTVRWYRLLKTTELTKRCFMSFMPFPWLTRHINANYTDRLCFPKPPGSKQTAAISSGEDGSGACRHLWCTSVCVFACAWALGVGVLAENVCLLIKMGGKWGIWAYHKNTVYPRVFFYSLHPWVIRYTTPGGSSAPLLQHTQIVERKMFGQSVGKSWCLFGSVIRNLIISVPPVCRLFLLTQCCINLNRDADHRLSKPSKLEYVTEPCLSEIKMFSPVILKVLKLTVDCLISAFDRAVDTTTSSSAWACLLSGLWIHLSFSKLTKHSRAIHKADIAWNTVS